MPGNSSWNTIDAIYRATPYPSRDTAFYHQVCQLLVDRENDAIRYALGLLHHKGSRCSRCEAEDCYHSFLLSNLNGILHSFDPEIGPFRTYLFSRFAKTYRRHLGKRPRTVSLDSETGQVKEPEATGDGPEEIFRRNEIAEFVSEAVERLPELERSVMQGRLAGESYAVIANKLGISENYAKVLALRARQMLAEYFKNKGIGTNAF